MDIRKFTPKPLDIMDQPNKERRSFMWRMGAAMSAVLASAVPGKTSSDTEQETIRRLSNRMGMLEDQKTIRRLHQTYENLLNNGEYEQVMNLFSEDGEVAFNGGLFQGRTGGVRRLYGERFRSGLTGRRIESAPGFQPDTGLQEDFIEVAVDRCSARARFPYSIQVGTPIISDSQLVQMARLHGEGIMKWWEGGTYEISYIKDTGEGDWKIKRLEYRTLSKTNYRPGKYHARLISVPLFSKVYPEDPAGPDKLIDHV